jgi:hypothetical protein
MLDLLLATAVAVPLGLVAATEEGATAAAVVMHTAVAVVEATTEAVEVMEAVETEDMVDTVAEAAVAVMDTAAGAGAVADTVGVEDMGTDVGRCRRRSVSRYRTRSPGRPAIPSLNLTVKANQNRSGV